MREKSGMRDESVGVYLHVPFCERVCPYCDFAVVAARPLERADEEAYVDALLCELDARRRDFAGLALESLYLGGGTPSLLHPDSVARLVSAAREVLPAREGAEVEITLEVNPSTVERERLPGFRAAGVNRLSIGIQSFDDAILKRLGRAHRAEEGRATWQAARAAGFASLSLDLIFGVPGQTLAGLRADLAEILALSPEHVSAYALTFEPDTPFGRALASGRIEALPDDEVAAHYETVAESLAQAGLPPYEISSYARPGQEAVHNRRYWERRPVLGLGVGAWSTEPRSAAFPHGARRHNLRSIPEYLARIGAGTSPQGEATEVLDARTARGEAVFLALRTTAGLDPEGFASEFGRPPRAFFAAEIDELLTAELLEEGPMGAIRLTPRGRLLSDGVFERYV